MMTLKKEIVEVVGNRFLANGKILGKMLGVSPATIAWWNEQDGLPATTLGRTRYYDLLEVCEWLDRRNGRATPVSLELRKVIA